MKSTIAFCLLAIVALSRAEDEETPVEDRSQEKRSIGLDSYGSYGGGYGLGGHVVSQHVEAVPVYKPIALPVPHPVPVAVPQPVPIHVPSPIPVHIPVPVPVVKTVAIPIAKPVPYPVEKPYPVEIIKKIPYPVPKPYPVPIHIYKVKHIYHGHSYHGW